MRLQITAGRGPREVQHFVSELAGLLERAVRAEGGTTERLSETAGSVQLQVGGIDLSGWLGTHELVDPVRGRGRRRRWFCALTQLPEGIAQGVFDPREVRVQACRAGGPGGQHVNTTSSAVRAVHLPTGLAVRVASERSQHRNRAEALRRLAQRWLERHRTHTAKTERIAQAQHDLVVRGQPVQRWTRRRGVLTRIGAR